MTQTNNNHFCDKSHKSKLVEKVFRVNYLFFTCTLHTNTVQCPVKIMKYLVCILIYFFRKYKLLLPYRNWKFFFFLQSIDNVLFMRIILLAC